jgi:glutamyl-tRNA synthetase
LVNPGKYGPYRQTEKLQEYQAIAQKLLDAKLAYYCFCTKEELNEMRDYAIKHNLPPKYNRKCLELSAKEIAENLKNNKEYVIRLKMPDNVNIEWNDLIRGKMSVPTSALTDPVLIRSNGLPLYNFAVVIDDCYMQISHVFRGEEHLSNTPYQIAIKNAIDQLKIKAYQNNTIQYGHLSIIVDASGKKLSKRDTTLKQFIEDYQKMGYVPEAVTNFISLLS